MKKQTILPRNPDRRRLMTRLGFPKGKMPKDFTFEGHLPLEDWHGNSYGDFPIVVTKSKPSFYKSRYSGEMIQQKSSKHRVFIKWGDRLIPVGRLAQASI